MINLIFEFSGNSIILPINPENIKLNIPGNNEKVNIVSLGEVVISREPGLTTFSISSFFPKENSPAALIAFFNTWRLSKRPAQFTASGLSISMQVVIEDFSYDRRSGEENDYYYDLSFSEYRPHAAKIVPITLRTATPASPERADNKPSVSQTYTVKSGDSLWAITKRLTGNGANWNALYNANKTVIGNDPNKIYPGQTLVIPSSWVTQTTVPPTTQTKSTSQTSGGGGQATGGVSRPR